MPTAAQIEFNELYSHASYFFLLLYNHKPHPSTPVELPHARLLSYVQPFGDLLACQQHVDNHRQKMITLFTTDSKFIRWHNDSPDLNSNLNPIYIYCDTLEGHSRIIGTQNSYSRNIQKVLMVQELDFDLLIAGLQYIRNVSQEFQDDPGVCNLFRADGRRVLQAMNNYFENGAVRLSQEATN